MPYCKFYKTKFRYYSVYIYIEFLFTIYGIIVFIFIA